MNITFQMPGIRCFPFCMGSHCKKNLPSSNNLQFVLDFSAMLFYNEQEYIFEGGIVMAQSTIQGKYLIYQNLPLVRENNLICYGSTDDKYVLFLMILTNKTVQTPDPNVKIEIPDKILGQIVSTDMTKPPHERMVKQFERNGLADAIAFGMIQLERYNKK